MGAGQRALIATKRWADILKSRVRVLVGAIWLYSRFDEPLGPRNVSLPMQLNEVALVSSSLILAPTQMQGAIGALNEKLAAIFLMGLACDSAQAKDAFYRCGHDSSYEEIAMAIRNDRQRS